MSEPRQGRGEWVVSVDIGGTKTEVLLLHIGRREGVHRTGEGANPILYGSGGLERVSRLLREALRDAHLDPANVRECVVGMAGISHPRYGRLLGKNLSNLFSLARLTVTSDAELAHRGLWGHHPGITLVAGTGSIAIGTDTEGRIWRAGGFGFQTGDEGGGYWLGKTVLMELIAAERSPAREVAELRNRILEFSDQSDFDELLGILSSGAGGVIKVAALSPVVFDAARKGNSLASMTVARGAQALVRLVTEVWEKTKLEGGKITVGASGSVIRESEFYRSRVRDELLLDFDAVDWRLSDYPPIYGGLVMAGIVRDSGDLGSLDVARV